MSAFSNVDAAVDPSRLLASLADSARGLTSMKHYMAAAHAPRGGIVLNVGCGSGHDLAVLERLGVASIGIDPSEVMLSSARSRTTCPTTRSTGEQLPFRDAAFAGCWIERVLMHVADPGAVLREVVRCLEPGGLITVFEPDWSSLTVNRSRVPLAWSSSAQHPSVGADVGTLFEELGCFVRDRVEERSWWTFPEFDAITNASLSRAAAAASDGSEIDEWLVQVRASAADGSFTAEMVKLLWVATTAA